LWIACEIVGKKFQRDEAAETRVFGFIDDAHTAAAEFLDDAVMGKRSTVQRGRIGHGRRDSRRIGAGSQ